MMLKGHEIRPALLVIDLQNCFLSRGGSYDVLGINTSDYSKALPKMRAVIERCKGSGIPVFYTQAVRERSGIDLLTKTHRFLPTPREERIQSVPICVRGTWDADIIDDIKPTDPAEIIVKRKDSAFFGTDLESRLQGLRVDTLVICGVDTSICVETSLRDAFNLGHDVVLISDATASMDPKRYQYTLDDVRSFYGLVMETDEFLNECLPASPSEFVAASAGRDRPR